MSKVWTLENALETLSKLDENKKPEWGHMSAQRMVEHLTDLFKVASGKVELQLLVPEDKLEGMLRFLKSDKPMAKNIDVPFAKKETPVRNENMELAIDEFSEEWVEFEEVLSEEGKTTLHPYYGNLDLEHWLLLNNKHLTHHFTQFGLI